MDLKGQNILNLHEHLADRCIFLAKGCLKNDLQKYILETNEFFPPLFNIDLVAIYKIIHTIQFKIHYNIMIRMSIKDHSLASKNNASHLELRHYSMYKIHKKTIADPSMTI